ncbi:hypothetical protein [Rubrivirga sp.]|uniref:hypothetical protein n=1 Tax=Rubrivirga sp. TaxID=1885344 RepID=UPI003C77047D
MTHRDVEDTDAFLRRRRLVGLVLEVAPLPDAPPRRFPTLTTEPVPRGRRVDLEGGNDMRGPT